ncbi:Tetratricopeptide repeat-like superfamily protein [Prunus dulcis]|uniref:Tetratricopeptide repeat-like superfamily protein n=1 Tax=Prunus dulcis TaxID=3755 RepID=A0A4Y1RY65_PRUDU|nr:Tetratricopeptide repeat-like superfamily protein [Prunus dulcis]
MKQKGLVKPPGFSRIELDGEIHEFAVGDSGHPEAETIYRKLEEIEDNLRKEGYDPKLSEVLLEIDDEEKAFQLSHHSEKLALAFGLIRTSPESEIRIVKNLRSCENCHAVMKTNFKGIPTRDNNEGSNTIPPFQEWGLLLQGLLVIFQ